LNKETNRPDQSGKRHILFLDDDGDTCEMISLILGQAGYEVVIGRSVTEGLQWVRRKSFDMILTDWHFDDGTGVELCRAVRQSDGRTPIFFYTGEVQDQHIQSALQAGAQGFFIKPVDMEILLKTISSQISPRGHGDGR
jgi:DNA-binding response OmpR family regulator